MDGFFHNVLRLKFEGNFISDWVEKTKQEFKPKQRRPLVPNSWEAVGGALFLHLASTPNLHEIRQIFLKLFEVPPSPLDTHPNATFNLLASQRSHFDVLIDLYLQHLLPRTYATPADLLSNLRLHPTSTAKVFSHQLLQNVFRHRLLFDVELECDDSLTSSEKRVITEAILDAPFKSISPHALWSYCQRNVAPSFLERSSIEKRLFQERKLEEYLWAQILYNLGTSSQAKDLLCDNLGFPWMTTHSLFGTGQNGTVLFLPTVHRPRTPFSRKHLLQPLDSGLPHKEAITAVDILQHLTSPIDESFMAVASSPLKTSDAIRLSSPLFRDNLVRFGSICNIGYVRRHHRPANLVRFFLLGVAIQYLERERLPLPPLRQLSKAFETIRTNTVNNPRPPSLQRHLDLDAFVLVLKSLLSQATGGSKKAEKSTSALSGKCVFESKLNGEVTKRMQVRRRVGPKENFTANDTFLFTISAPEGRDSDQRSRGKRFPLATNTPNEVTNYEVDLSVLVNKTFEGCNPMTFACTVSYFLQPFQLSPPLFLEVEMSPVSQNPMEKRRSSLDLSQFFIKRIDNVLSLEASIFQKGISFRLDKRVVHLEPFQTSDETIRWKISFKLSLNVKLPANFRLCEASLAHSNDDNLPLRDLESGSLCVRVVNLSEVGSHQEKELAPGVCVPGIHDLKAPRLGLFKRGRKPSAITNSGKEQHTWARRLAVMKELWEAVLTDASEATPICPICHFPWRTDETISSSAPPKFPNPLAVQMLEDNDCAPSGTRSSHLLNSTSPVRMDFGPPGRLNRLRPSEAKTRSGG